MVNVPNPTERLMIKNLIANMMMLQNSSNLSPISCLIATHTMNLIMHGEATRGKSPEFIEQMDMMTAFCQGFAAQIMGEIKS